MADQYLPKLHPRPPTYRSELSILSAALASGLVFAALYERVRLFCDDGRHDSANGVQKRLAARSRRFMHRLVAPRRERCVTPATGAQELPRGQTPRADPPGTSRSWPLVPVRRQPRTRLRSRRPCRSPQAADAEAASRHSVPGWQDAAGDGEAGLDLGGVAVVGREGDPLVLHAPVDLPVVGGRAKLEADDDRVAVAHGGARRGGVATDR